MPIIIGIAAFAISVYWTVNSSKTSINKEQNPGLKVIWERFPKFVLGFLAASLLFSFIVSPTAIASSKESLKNIQTLWFVLAFTSIGLETNFADLLHRNNRKPLYAFIIAQSFNILITLLVAYLLFRGYNASA